MKKSMHITQQYEWTVIDVTETEFTVHIKDLADPSRVIEAVTFPIKDIPEYANSIYQGAVFNCDIGYVLTLRNPKN